MRDHDPLSATGSAPSKARGSPRERKFSLAANYDPELVPQLAPYPVDEVYGKFPTDGISGGRPRYLATPLSEADLRAYIRLLDQHGIAFNYLLNGACFGNREWTRSWHKGVTALLERLGEMGVSRLTVYEAMGYTHFKLLERGIPSAELLRRVKAYSEGRFEGNLAELLLSYGFQQPTRKESLWSLRHFWKPRQVKQWQLKPLRELAQLQGWLSPLPDCPIRVEARKIPDVFMPQRGKLCQPRAKPWDSEPPNPKP